VSALISTDLVLKRFEIGQCTFVFRPTCRSLGTDHVRQSGKANNQALANVNRNSVRIPFIESSLRPCGIECDIEIPVSRDKVQHGWHGLKESTIDGGFDWLSRSAYPRTETRQCPSQSVEVLLIAKGKNVNVLRGQRRTMKYGRKTTDDDEIDSLLFQSPQDSPGLEFGLVGIVSVHCVLPVESAS